MIYDPFDMAVRELGGGIWFWVSGALVLAFAAFIVRELKDKRVHGRKWTQADFASIWTAVSLAVFAAGSMGRGFLNWMQFHYARQGKDPTMWVDLWPWLGTAVIFTIVGGLGAVWFLTTWRYRTLFVVLTFLLAIGVPVAFYFDPS